MTVKQFFKDCEGAFDSGLGELKVYIYALYDDEDFFVRDLDFYKVRLLPSAVQDGQIGYWDVIRRDNGRGVAIRIGLKGRTEDYE